LSLRQERLAEQPNGRSRTKVTWRMKNHVRELSAGRRAVINDDDISFSLQQGTHWDSLGHFGVLDGTSDAAFFGGRSADDVANSNDLRVDAYAPGIVGRGVLLDFVDLIAPGTRALPGDYVISLDDVSKVLARQKLSLTPGDIVCIYTGFETTIGADGVVPRVSAGLHTETLPLWRDARIAALLADNPAVEPMPPSLVFHSGALRNLGIPLGELWALEELATACSASSRWEFLFVSVPLTVSAFGSPGNGIAIM
jgi:kynurenine formamidase